MELSLPRSIQHSADRHVTTLPPTLLHATSNPDTTRVDMKLLVRLHETLSFEGFRRVRSWFYANLLHVDVTSIRTSLRHLEELGYLERGERDGDSFTFRLKNPCNGDSPPPILSAA